MDFSNLNDHLKGEGEPMVFTSYETGNELDLDKMFNHLGPERSFAMANMLLDMVQADFSSAMNESLKNYVDVKTVEYERGYNTAKECFKQYNNIQTMFNDSRNASNQSDFDAGWQAFCLENGAVDDKDGFQSIA
jgi:hypothetical protein